MVGKERFFITAFVVFYPLGGGGRPGARKGIGEGSYRPKAKVPGHPYNMILHPFNMVTTENNASFVYTYTFILFLFP